MKTTQVRNGVWAVAAALIPAIIMGFSMGPDPRYTAAPGDKSKACATAGCHTQFKTGEGGPVNFHGGSVTAAFSQGSTYVPGGQPISITVRVTDPQNTTYGFQMTARLESNLAAAQAGRFTAGAGTFVLCDNGSPRSPSGNCPPTAPVEFIEHTRPSTAPWTFTWTPPADGSGPVHFYVAGNAVNGNGVEDAGDHVYIAEYVLNPAGACVAARPSIAAVISAGAFGGRADFAAGSWLEIYGENFSSVTKEWAGLDFQGAAAPSTLDRVRVSIRGKPAFIRFISPAQVNVQAPADDFVGAADITVSNCDQTSAAFSLPKRVTAPGLLAPPAFRVNDRQFLAALFQDGVTFVGEFAGIPSRPARPGDRITTYGVGFGETNPATPPGTIVSSLNSIPGLTVRIGNADLPPSSINYAGLTPGFVGLYQFNLVVPDLPDGDYPVEFRLDGELLPQTLFIRIRR
jgi:uncharacterized protein (TIGR03437 family)